MQRNASGAVEELRFGWLVLLPCLVIATGLIAWLTRQLSEHDAEPETLAELWPTAESGAE
ncbi:MAG: hypothetical protein R3B90_22955 [Planctomycetaceae bacterium]